MKKISLVLALVMLFGVLGSMFAVSAADEPIRYDFVTLSRGFSNSAYHADYGKISTDVSKPGAEMKVVRAKDAANYGNVTELPNLDGISAHMIDIGAAQKVNALCYSVLKTRVAPYSSEDSYGHKAATYWYSVDGVNYTQLENVTVQASGEYYQFNTTKTDDKGYAMEFKASFPEVEARYVMIVTPDTTVSSDFVLAYAQANIYLLYEENANADTGDATAIIAFGAVAAVSCILFVTKKKKH